MPASPKPLWLEWTVAFLVGLMITVTRLMPLAWTRSLGRGVGASLYHVNSRMRRVAIRNLELAYPQWTSESAQSSGATKCAVHGRADGRDGSAVEVNLGPGRRRFLRWMG